MKEKKFRAWDEVNKVMVYDCDTWQPSAITQPRNPPQTVRVCSHFIVYPYSTPYKSYVRVEDEHGRGQDYYKDWDYDKLFSSGLIFQQYTGLKDKNDKETYQNDIVRGTIDDELHIWQVVWETDDMLGWSIDNTNEPFEVIGNIHESPELLMKNR